MATSGKGLLAGTWIFGRQFQSYGLGLLVDNARESQQGVRHVLPSLWGYSLGFDLFAGGANMWHYNRAASDMNYSDVLCDGYASMRVAYARSTWTLDGSYLHNGVSDETGYSLDLAVRVFGRNIRVEQALLKENRFYESPTGERRAVMATADLWKGSNWTLRGFYSKADSQYDVYYSATNPYYEWNDPYQSNLGQYYPHASHPPVGALAAQPAGHA